MTDSPLYTKSKNAEVSDKERLPTQEKHKKVCFCRGYTVSRAELKKMTKSEKITERQCETDRLYGTDGEWCRTYCPIYGTGRCHYDPETKKMMVREESQ